MKLGLLKKRLRHRYGRSRHACSGHSHAGWSNAETWSVVLNIENDRAVYDRARSHGPFTAESLRSFVRRLFPGGTPEMKSWMGGRAGLSKVNWTEAARGINERLFA